MSRWAIRILLEGEIEADSEEAARAISIEQAARMAKEANLADYHIDECEPLKPWEIVP